VDGGEFSAAICGYDLGERTWGNPRGGRKCLRCEAKVKSGAAYVKEKP
jgi:hypothetical protein